VTHPQPRLPAEDRRRQLLDTALDFFARKGFEGTTTKEIAAAAGVTEAIIFRHFPSKQALYSAVFNYHQESGEFTDTLAKLKVLMDVNDDIGLCRALIEGTIAKYRTDSRMQRALLFAALEGHHAGLEQHREAALPVFELLCQYVARRQSEGAIRPGPPGAVVGSIVGAAVHFAMMTQFFGFRPPVTDGEAASAFLEILLHGIMPVSPEKAIA
jgi:TetR/AcrR family transcriptional regulator